MRRLSCPSAMVMAGFVLSTAVVRPSPVVAQNRVFKSGVELVPLTVTSDDVPVSCFSWKWRNATLELY